MNTALTHLQNLINIDTRPAARGETRAARYLEKQLTLLQTSSTLAEPLAGCGSITARIRGTRADCLLLLSHLDTADYDPARWRVPPDRATVTSKAVFGRGALDCKGLTAVHLAVFERLLRSGRTPKKTIVFAATANEESGGEWGCRWLLEHTDWFDRAQLVLSEGGGYPVALEGRQLFTLQTGEACVAASGAPTSEQEILQTAQARRYYSDTTLFYAKQASSLAEGRRIDPDSFVKDVWGQLQQSPGGRQDFPEIFRAVNEILRLENPAYTCMPFITPGHSDNRFFREKGIDTLGFFPLAPGNPIGGIHGDNECMTRESLTLACDVLYRLVWRLAMED